MIVKKAVVGTGHADEEQVAMMVTRLLPGCSVAAADAADALAVAISTPTTSPPAAGGPPGWRTRSPPALPPGMSWGEAGRDRRSEEHTSELQSLMRNSYAVFCLKKKNQN